MKSFYKLLLITLVLPLFSIAQSNYKPGYVITLKGDTVKGFIDYQEWNKNPGSINFKNAITDSKSQKYSTDNMSAFTVSGIESYLLYIGDITMDSIDPNHIAEGRDTSFKTTAVFLKVLQKGSRLTLYSYSDDVKTRFFIKENMDQKIKELIFRTYFDTNHVDNVNGNGRTVNEGTYLNQLYSIAQKYNVINDDFQWQINHAFYDKPHILKLVSLINGISDAELKKERGNVKGANLFASLGLNSSTTTPANGYLAAGGKNYTSNLPFVSFGVNILANPNSGRLQFRIELMLGQNQYKSVYLNKVQPLISVKYSFNQTEIGLAPQVIYNFHNAQKLKIYAGAGVSVTSFKYSNATFGGADGTASASDITTYNPYSFNSFALLIMFKVGAEFNKKWGIYADYLTLSNNSQDAYFQTNVTTIQAGINYNF